VRAIPEGEYSSELTTLTDEMLTINAADRPSVRDVLQADIMKTTQHKYKLIPSSSVL